jgi:chemotaxis receptor (MCP) glutamine deamidase CheD
MAHAAPREASIHIGGVFASREPALVKTLLGSCVAACVYDLTVRIGGMNHFMLPEAASDGIACSRFGVHAMELLINRIMRLGGDRRRLEAKAFGGADLLGFDRLNVGSKNVDFIRCFLHAEGIPLAAERLGGHEPLAVHFCTATARAFVKPVRRASLDELARQEQRFHKRFLERSQRERSGDVTLF